MRRQRAANVAALTAAIVSSTARGRSSPRARYELYACWNDLTCDAVGMSCGEGPDPCEPLTAAMSAACG